MNQQKGKTARQVLVETVTLYDEDYYADRISELETLLNETKTESDEN